MVPRNCHSGDGLWAITILMETNHIVLTCAEAIFNPEKQPSDVDWTQEYIFFVYPFYYNLPSCVNLYFS